MQRFRLRRGWRTIAEMRILLVEDELDLADAVVRRLTRAGHAVDLQRDGLDASAVLSYQQYDLVILDIGLPRRDGFELLSELRRRSSTTRILMLTARGEIDDRVRGLAAGADDYLPKPFDFREFDERCKALLRRRQERLVPSKTTIGPFVLDRRKHLATLHHKPIALTKRELALLTLLIDEIGSVVTKEEITRQLNNFDNLSGDNALQQIVGQLRDKLHAAPLVIRTVRGVGYIVERATGTGNGD